MIVEFVPASFDVGSAVRSPATRRRKPDSEKTRLWRVLWKKERKEKSPDDFYSD
ncbi:hypothetical protein SBDP2_330010 [Syntrophobacter sp. SbD2]|nr:hypothetical protein SBDP2_330010 [Syntrophobacter sp. SbD2]